MKISDFIKFELNESPIKSEIMGQRFEKKVLGVLLRKSWGVDRIKLIDNSIINSDPVKTIVMTLPKLDIYRERDYFDVDKHPKSSKFPDFKISVMDNKKFLGYDNKFLIWIEAKTSARGQIKFGQKDVRQTFVISTEFGKYLVWSLDQSKPKDFNQEEALRNVNLKRRLFLETMKILPGGDYRLVHALSKGDGVAFYSISDAIDILDKGKFIINARGVLVYEYNGKALFRLQNVSSKRKAKRVVATQKNIEKFSKEKKINEAKINYLHAGSSFYLTFVAETDLYTGGNVKLPRSSSAKLINRKGVAFPRINVTIVDDGRKKRRRRLSADINKYNNSIIEDFKVLTNV